IWEARISGLFFAKLYRDIFFVSSYGESLKDAPVTDGAIDSGCSFIDDKISLLAYNAYTGEKIWGFRFDKAFAVRMYFEDRVVYLRGSANHGYSNDRTLSKIDASSGLLLSLECTEWPQEPIQPPLTTSIGDDAQPQNIVQSEKYLNLQQGNPLFMVAE